MHPKAKLVGLHDTMMRPRHPYCKSLGREKGIGSNQVEYFRYREASFARIPTR